MSVNNDFIDALLAYMETVPRPDLQNALTTLVDERDALRIEMAKARSYWRDRAERRDAEQKSAADRDLRNDLICAALTGAMTQEGWRSRDAMAAEVVAAADATLAAMRKGAGDGK